jgi:hypothetical protein
VRGSSTTIAVLPERSAAQPSYWSLNSAHRAQSRSRSSPHPRRSAAAAGPSAGTWRARRDPCGGPALQGVHVQCPSRPGR